MVRLLDCSYVRRLFINELYFSNDGCEMMFTCEEHVPFICILLLVRLVGFLTSINTFKVKANNILPVMLRSYAILGKVFDFDKWPKACYTGACTFFCAG